MNCAFCGLEPSYRTVYDDLTCTAVLEEEQSVKGYTLVILKNHYNTVLDSSIQNDELTHFWRTVQRIGNAIKDSLDAENVYVCTLCDGIKHFHVHLIPRYRWTQDDKARYIALFTERDGEESVKNCTDRGLIGGFWWLADAERNYNETEFMKLPEESRRRIIERTAAVICESMK